MCALNFSAQKKYFYASQVRFFQGQTIKKQSKNTHAHKENNVPINVKTYISKVVYIYPTDFLSN